MTAATCTYLQHSNFDILPHIGQHVFEISYLRLVNLSKVMNSEFPLPQHASPKKSVTLVMKENI